MVKSSRSLDAPVQPIYNSPILIFAVRDTAYASPYAITN